MLKNDDVVAQFVRGFESMLRTLVLTPAQLRGLSYAIADPRAMSGHAESVVGRYDHMTGFDVEVTGVYSAAAQYLAAFRRAVAEGCVTPLDPLVFKLIELGEVNGTACFSQLYLMETVDLCGGVATIPLVRNGLQSHQLSECSLDIVFTVVLHYGDKLPLGREVIFFMKPVLVHGRRFVLGVTRTRQNLSLQLHSTEVIPDGDHVWAAIHLPDMK